MKRLFDSCEQAVVWLLVGGCVEMLRVYGKVSTEMVLPFVHYPCIAAAHAKEPTFFCACQGQYRRWAWRTSLAIHKPKIYICMPIDIAGN